MKHRVTFDLDDQADEAVRLLAVFDQVVPRIPVRPLVEVEAELASLRSARRRGGRRTFNRR